MQAVLDVLRSFLVQEPVTFHDPVLRDERRTQRGGDTKDRAALVSAIEKVAYTGPRGPMKMAKNHQATQNVYIVKTVKKDNAVAFDILDTYQNVEDPVKGCNLD